MPPTEPPAAEPPTAAPLATEPEYRASGSRDAGVPPLAIVLSLAALVPFGLAGLLAVSAGETGPLRATLALIGYGAVMLGFLGGVHWGLSFAAGPGLAARGRLGGGLLPPLLGWAALLLALLTRPVFGLALLIAAYIGTAVVEAEAHRRGLLPGGYMGLRWVCTVVVAMVLCTVLVLRLLGAHVLL